MFTNLIYSSEDKACCFPDRGNQAAKFSCARPQRRFPVPADWLPLHDLAELGHEPTDYEIETLSKLVERDCLIFAAEQRLLAKAKHSAAAAKDFSQKILGVLVVEVNDQSIQVDRTYQNTPPGSIGLPHRIVFIALAARLLPVPADTVVLEHGGRGIYSIGLP